MCIKHIWYYVEVVEFAAGMAVRVYLLESALKSITM